MAGKIGRKIIDILLFTFLNISLWLRYRLRVKNLPLNDNRPILFLPNHPALIDPVILYRVLGPRFRPRPLVDATQAARPVVKQAVNHLNAIIIPDATQVGRQAMQEVERGLGLVASALQNGDNVLFYPSGHIYHSALETIGGNSGLKAVLERMETTPRLVLVRSSGLWGSSFGCASGSYPKVGAILKNAVLALLANLVLFMPRRKVNIEFSEPEDFRQIAQSRDKKAINHYLETFYNTDAPGAFKVPFFFWQGSRPQAMPEPDARNHGQALEIPQPVQNAVLAYLRQLSGENNIRAEQKLGADLGLDSLSLVEAGLWLEEEFGFHVPELESLITVQDCLEAAMGLNNTQESKRPTPIAQNWFPKAHDAQVKLSMPAAPVPAGQSVPSLASLFLAQAKQNPQRPLVADRARGIRTFRQTLMAIEALLPTFTSINNQRIGIMLPMAPAAISSWLTCLLAGKTPVMVNWTVGEANLRHCLGLSKVDTVVTARALLNRLARQGFDPEAITWQDGTKVRFIYLEDVAASLTLKQKITAWGRAVFSRRLDKIAVSNASTNHTAAILFTSGSESLPKAVPLNHANLAANLLDAVKVLDVRRSDRLLGLLPPFHSLGLLANLALPACMGIPMACHPNPTEAVSLVTLVKNYGLSMVVTPPTFLGNMLQRSQGSEDLASLRLAFVGAEKCPQQVYQAFSEQCPQGVLCEGYGVSECSPIVSVNHPQNPHPGTIGSALASLETMVLVGPETNPELTENMPAAPGQPGLLLVRGPSVFSGYLPAPAGYTSPESPFMEFMEKTWYRTGDLVSRDEGGILTFCGRLKRFIKLGGEMISLPQIEHVLLTAFAHMPKEQDGPLLAVEAIGDDALITLFTTVDISREAANGVLREGGLSGLYSIRQVVRLEQLPVLGTGKVDYRNLAGYAFNVTATIDQQWGGRIRQEA